MKLLTVIESLGNGGAERVLLNTLPELSKKGVFCEVAILFKDDFLAGQLEQSGITIHRLNLSHKWNIPEALRKLHQILEKGNFDIIHAHIFFAHFYVGLYKLLFQKRLKTVITFHNLGYNTYPANTLWRKLRKKIDALVVSSFDRKIAVSTAVAKHFAEHLKLKDIAIIFNSFPVATIQKQSKAVIDITQLINRSYAHYVVTPGRLVKEKGHQFLLAAIQKIQRNDIAFLIVGDGPLKEQLVALKHQYKLENLYFLGQKNHTELLQIINASDLVVTPSLSEGFPMIVGEAMSVGKAVIATHVGGIPDFIDNNINGIMIPPADAESLAEQIIYLIENSEITTNLANNAKNKIKIFDTPLIIDKWLNLYKELAH